ncbi:MAG: hypothetical protein IKG27_03135 [Bacilli bacterium]|nr:hypothetical protein [Bacilli bacterium]
MGEKDRSMRVYLTDWQDVENMQKMIDEEGENYRRVVPPVLIEIIDEEREIPAKAFDLYFTDAEPTRVVPAGTILISGRYDISQEELENNYIPYVDKRGNTIPDKAIRVEEVKALQNPFSQKIVIVHGNGFKDEAYDADCYFVKSITPKHWAISILPKEDFEREYVPFEKTMSITK